MSNSAVTSAPRPQRRRNLPMGERVLPGIWRLRLPLPRGVAICNAWAIAARGGIVLVDRGMRHPSSLTDLRWALDQCKLSLGDVRLLVLTHDHADHCGQAADVADIAGCEIWAHPGYGATWQGDYRSAGPSADIARRSGVPEQVIDEWEAFVAQDAEHLGRRVAPARALHDGDEVPSALGPWVVQETPGHTPSHICLFEPERRLLLCGDHLMGKVSVFFEYGWAPDPVGEFLRSLDRTDALDARLGLSGHGRTFIDVPGRIAANRRLVQDRLAETAALLSDDGAMSGFDVMGRLYGDLRDPIDLTWWLSTALSYLRHLEVTGRVRRLAGLRERWSVPTEG